MGVVWLILKILGITLLSILGLVLLLLLLILFVPIRYSAEGKAESKEDYRGTVRVHWLLHIISLRIDAESPLKVTKRLRIFWFFGKKGDETIFPKEKEEASEEKPAEVESAESKPQETATTEPAETTANATAETAVTEPETPAEPAEPKPETKSETTAETKPETTAETKPEKPAETKPEESAEAATAGTAAEEKPEKKGLTERISDKIEDCKETASCVAELFSRKKGLAEKYIKKKSTKAAWAKLKKTALWLLKHIAPRKGHAEITFGMKNPETTGKIYAVAANLYPWYWKHVDLYPEFGGEIIAGEGSLKGRIRLFGVVIRGLSILLDKNIKKMRKEFTKVKDSMTATPGELKKIVKKEAA